MAYTTPNTGIIRPWDVRKNRYIHRQFRAVVGANGGFATGVYSGQVTIPCPGRLVAISYGKLVTSDAYSQPTNATSGTLVVKADTTAGVQIFTDADISGSVSATRPVPVGTTSLDEGAAATAATDGFSGGFPVRGGVFISGASATDDEIIVVDCYFRLCTYIKLNLVSQSGADGSGAVTRQVDLGNAGVLSAIAIDYQNMPATTDIVIKADSSGGPTLHTRTSSNTDLGPTLLGSPGFDEAINVVAATDGTECGLAFKRGLYFDVAEADAFTSGNEQIVIECWIDD